MPTKAKAIDMRIKTKGKAPMLIRAPKMAVNPQIKTIR